MRKILMIASAGILAGSVAAWAAETATNEAAPSSAHSVESMTSGHHVMPGNKQDHMSNKAGMPGLNPKCFGAALAKMPPEHRAACHKSD